MNPLPTKTIRKENNNYQQYQKTMKKFFVGAAVAALTMVGVSCQGGGTPKTNADSLAYAQGMMQGKRYAEMITMSAQQGMNLDKEAFLKGLREGIKDTTSFSYFAGGFTGAQMSKQMLEDSVNLQHFLSAFELALKADSTTTFLINDSIAQELMMKAQEISRERAMKKHEEEQEKLYGANKQKGTEFLQKFKTEEGVNVTESGLAYKYITQGAGTSPKADDKVKVSYVGTLINGKEFDKNDDIEFPVSGVIKGWTEMLQLMKVGDKVKVVIPQELAYGAQGAGADIEPFSTLVFEMELKEVLPNK